jgi:predicted transcriptional regulator
MKYRSKIELMCQILEVAKDNGGATKTRIMYKAFLSYIQLKEQIPFLLERKLLKFDVDTLTYKTTEKGLEFIELYNKMSRVIFEEKEEQNELQPQL